MFIQGDNHHDLIKFNKDILQSQATSISKILFSCQARRRRHKPNDHLSRIFHAVKPFLYSTCQVSLGRRAWGLRQMKTARIRLWFSCLCRLPEALKNVWKEAVTYELMLSKSPQASTVNTPQHLWAFGCSGSHPLGGPWGLLAKCLAGQRWPGLFLNQRGEQCGKDNEFSYCHQGPSFRTFCKTSLNFWALVYLFVQLFPLVSNIILFYLPSCFDTTLELVSQQDPKVLVCLVILFQLPLSSNETIQVAIWNRFTKISDLARTF